MTPRHFCLSLCIAALWACSNSGRQDQRAASMRPATTQTAINKAYKNAISVAKGNDELAAAEFLVRLNMALAPGRADFDLDSQEKLSEAVPEMLPLGYGDIKWNKEFFDNTRFLIDHAVQAKVLIVGGTPADPQEFPDCVAVGGPLGWCCSGTLVAKNVVVTAAHCADVCLQKVFFGNDITGKGEEVVITNVYRHPDYNPTTLSNDLAVAVLDRDVVYAPRPMERKGDPFAPQVVRVVGFGSTQVDGSGYAGIKRRADVPVRTWQCDRPIADCKYGCRRDLEFSAAVPAAAARRDSCKGDSGGPAYGFLGSWILCGAVSRKTNNSVHECGDGGVYTRIQAYSDWIKSVPGGHW